MPNMTTTAISILAAFRLACSWSSPPVLWPSLKVNWSLPEKMGKIVHINHGGKLPTLLDSLLTYFVIYSAFFCVSALSAVDKDFRSIGDVVGSELGLKALCLHVVEWEMLCMTITPVARGKPH